MRVLVGDRAHVYFLLLYALTSFPELDELSHQSSGRHSVVLITTMPDAEIIRWPHNGWEVAIMRDGTVRSRNFGHSFPVPIS